LRGEHVNKRNEKKRIEITSEGGRGRQGGREGESYDYA
jgi:uncharacterized protein Veg